MIKTVDIAAKVPLEDIEMIKTVGIAAKVPLEDIQRH